MKKQIERLIEELKNDMERAEQYKSEDSAMGYAYKYGMLRGSIKNAIIELNHLSLVSQLNSKKNGNN